MSFAQTFSLRRQGLTILTTEGCNFTCVYCHQPHRPMHMGQETIEAIINFVQMKSKEIDNLDISWFGGEPLINLRAVRALAAAFQRICEAEAIELQGFMSTNGYLLTRSLFEELVDLGITRYQITFDGPEHVHNQHRLAVNGRPTFAPLWRNVTSFKDVPRSFEVLIRVHVTPSTVDAVRDFLQDLASEFGGDPRFKITVANVSHWGGPNDAAIPVFADPAPARRALSAGIRSENKTVEGNAACNASSPNDLVIRPDGTVVKCAHSLDLEQNRLGHLTRDGQFVYLPGTIDPWIRGLLTHDKRALECPRDGIEKLHSPRSLLRKRTS